MRRNSKDLSVVAVTLISLFFLVWFAPSANAQVTGATLSGTVTDSSGAAVPGAQISIKNTATGTERTLVSDSGGFYSAPNLLPGNYVATVKAAGFSTLIRSGLILTVGAQQQLNMTLQVGQVSQSVEVTGEAPSVELSSSEMSGTVNQSTVEDLPLNGRSWTDLAALTRGVSSVETTESGCSRGCGHQIAVNGARPTQNNYRVDGVSIMDQYNSGPGTQLGGNLGVDAIEEFSVITNNYAAEYGRTSGGVVNAVTRSGTNQIHGTAFMFLRDEDFDARNFFDPTSGNVGGRGIPPF
ncbi:MAG: carboxypeptidase regulatory-like domain-containing protein, partial [Candidatus Acidiferrales bacterium]